MIEIPQEGARTEYAGVRPRSLVRLDERYRKALALVIESGRASVSMVQRKLCIGYNEAQDLVARMLREGLISVEDTPGLPKTMAWAAQEAPAQAPGARPDAAAQDLHAAGPGQPDWMPIETAPKDGSPVILRFKDEFPEEHAAARSFAGAVFVGRNRGDLALWSFAAPVGCGGLPDEWLAGWRPLLSSAAPPDLSQWEKARFGFFHEDGRFETLTPEQWDHPKAGLARWVGGPHDMQLLRAVLAGSGTAQRKSS